MQPNDQAYWRGYIRLLVQLHRLVVAGEGDGDEADRVRDEMEIPWRNLSVEELARVNGLGSDLYSLDCDRPAPGEVPVALALEFQQAAKSCEWDQALTVLRKHETMLPPAYVACLRGVCWANFHEPVVATLFLAEALRLRPGDARLKLMYWRTLVRAGRIDEAKIKAEEALGTATDPLELLLAADVLLDWAAAQSEENATPVLGRVLETVNRATEASPGTVSP